MVFATQPSAAWPRNQAVRYAHRTPPLLFVTSQLPGKARDLFAKGHLEKVIDERAHIVIELVEPVDGVYIASPPSHFFHLPEIAL